MLTNKSFFIEEAAKLGITISDEEFSLYSRFFDMVADSNKKFNLTAITEEHDFIVKHYLDSLAGAVFLKNGGTLVDIGAGAGFPSVPLAIACPNINITAVDSTAKKTVFINEAAKELNIDNIRAVAARAEDLKDSKNTFDFAVARAVAPLAILLELIIPLLKTGGCFIAYKTDESEVDICKNACKTLNCVYKDCRSFHLPDGSRRCLLLFEKTADTPSIYPRQYSAIKKKPL